MIATSSEGGADLLFPYLLCVPHHRDLRLEIITTLAIRGERKKINIFREGKCFVDEGVEGKWRKILGRSK